MRKVFHFVRTASLVLLLAGAGRADTPPAPAAAPEAPAPVAAPGPPTTPGKVVVIPIREQIAQPMLYVLRRGLKTAIQQGADTVVLDMNTPGGRIDVTFEMLEALAKFPGRTLTYVNNEAVSAGALISAGTDDIYFAPNGVIGAAAPVGADGRDIDPTMKAKVVSFLKARVRAVAADKGYRAAAVSAMIDVDGEFKIGETVIKPKGELLSLTATEAMKPYGEPPVPLLGAGIADGIDGVLKAHYGARAYTVTQVEVTWSEHLAQYLTTLAPILMSLGILFLFIEFKTPGMGFFGIAGGVLLAAVFFGHYAAGLSGHEPAIFFVIGVILLLVEVFFLPGTALMAVAGLVLMLGSLVWSMADLWPNEPIQFTGAVFLQPLVTVLVGVLLAVGAFLVLLRFLPGGGPWSRMVLQAAVGGEPVEGRPLVAAAAGPVSGLQGREAVAATPLYPSGQVLVDGRRYEARMAVGFAEAGATLVVTGVGEFGLIVEVKPS